MPGLDKFLKGIVRYQKELRPTMVKQFEAIKANPEPKAVVFSCIDSRVLITRLVHADVGDMFLVRNAGNFVPHHTACNHTAPTTEPAALELACDINDVRNVIVCGHSDCKAMNTMYSMLDPKNVKKESPLHAWLLAYSQGTVKQFEHFEARGDSAPLSFKISAKDSIEAFIDPENKFQVQDKFSQVNTLQQLHNIASYPFMENKVATGHVRLHAMWFDVYTGNFFIFNSKEKRFVEVEESTLKDFQRQL